MFEQSCGAAAQGGGMTGRIGKIKAKTKCDLTTEAILSMLASGAYKAGDRLPPEGELMELFAVSRVTLREALKRLNTMGVVTIRQGDGTYVQNPDVKNVVQPVISGMVVQSLSINELYDARMFIEVGMVRLAARNRKKEDMEALRKLLLGMEKTMDPFDSAEFSALDGMFHEMIGKLSGNHVLLSTYTALRELIRYYISRTNISFETAKTSLFHHSQIVGYIEAGNEYLAGVTMEQHVDHAKRALLAQEGTACR